MAELEQNVSGVRNSEYRGLTNILDKPVEVFHKKVPGAKAKHATYLGIVFGIAAVEVEEYQNRRGKHTLRLTTLAMGLTLASWLFDLIDGKKARLERAEMTNPKEREQHEKEGQALDPQADGIIEAWRAGSSAVTAWLREDYFGVKAAIFNLRTTNRPREAKAIIGAMGIATPETYKIYDPRNLGTSFGRKAPNLISTFLPVVDEVPIQGFMDTFAGIANTLVTRERLIAISENERTLPEKDIKNADYRADVLGAESRIFDNVANILEATLV